MSASPPEAVDRLRRRLAVAISGSPFAAALHSAMAATPRAVPADEGAATATGRWVHAFAAYGEPKYPTGFTHFEYVNPDAPRGSTLRLRNPDRRTSFDKFNPFTTRGNAPSGVLIWMVEGLAHLSQDEPSTMYALLAEDMFVASDFSSVAFRIRREARFSNGDPVTPADVKHSFDTLSSKEASPPYQTALAGIERAEIIDATTVRFHLKQRTRDQLFVAGTLPIFSRKWGAGKKFSEIVAEHPITTGPYVIGKVDMPHRIEFVRNPNYWANALPGLGARRGHFNFDRIVYRNYADNAVAREAFKAGEFDLFKEYGARSWMRLHKGPKWDDGRIVKRSFVTGFGQLMQAEIINMRRPLFQDIRVREALVYTYDFESIYKTDLYHRADSLFNNSQFAAEGAPGPGELKLLEPFRKSLPPRVFGPAYRNPRTKDAPNGLRRNLLKARTLLEEAGWKLDAKGVLRNGRGEPFEFEYMSPREISDLSWQTVLEKLGITMKQRVVDFALYRSRLQKFDYDMITIAGGDFTLPDSGTLEAILGSKSADEEGNSNFRGVKDPAVDALIAAIGRADTMQELRDAARALDRVVTWSFFQVPVLYSNTENVSYWNRFGIPEVQAKFFNADTYFTGVAEFGPWPLWCWWDRSLTGKR